MWLDLLALGILAVALALGAWRGALETGFRLLALVASYALALYAGARSGAELALALGVQGWLGSAIASGLAFVAAGVLFAIVGLAVRRLDRHRLGDEGRSALDRCLGASFGLARGAIAVLLVGWLALFVDAVRITSRPALPDLSGAALPRVSGHVVERGAGAWLGDADPAARLATRLASRPGASARELQGLVESPAVRALQQDRRFWELTAEGDVERALSRPAARRLLDDPGVHRTLRELDLIESEAELDARVFRRELEAALREVGPRLRALREDPEVQRLAADPTLQRALAEGDTLALLTHPGFRRLLGRVAREGGG